MNLRIVLIGVLFFCLSTSLLQAQDPNDPNLPSELPIIDVNSMDSIVATGDDGDLLTLNGIDVNDLVLGMISTDFEKHADHPAIDGENFSLALYASLDDANYIDVTFDLPVTAIFIVERGGNDLGLIQPLDINGDAVGPMVEFAKSDWFKSEYKINGNQIASGIVLTADRPIYGITILPAPDGKTGLDPVSVSAIPDNSQI